MRGVFFGIFSILASVSAQVINDNGVCYHIDNGVRVIEDCPVGTLPSPSTDDNPTGHEANSTSTSTSTSSSASSTSTHNSESNNISSSTVSTFGGMTLGSVIVGMMFLV